MSRKVMNDDADEIVRREYRHGKVAYGFQWNKTHHERLGSQEGDLASLWAHLSIISGGKIPSDRFVDPFYVRSSTLKLPKMSAPRKVALRERLFRTGLVFRSLDSSLVHKIREYHRMRDDRSYSADHGILKEFLHSDSDTIAIEVPVWSDRYKLTGHVDLIRYVDGRIQVCDTNPARLSQPQRDFFNPYHKCRPMERWLLIILPTLFEVRSTPRFSPRSDAACSTLTLAGSSGQSCLLASWSRAT